MKLKYLFNSAFALLLLNGCSDDLEGGIPVSEGDPIHFSATIVNANSRTIYGDLADGKWPVYWAENDAVTIYCPQAKGSTSDEKTGKYTVTSPGDNKNSYALSGLNSLKWGAEDIHHFHTFYPSASLYHRDANAKDDGTFVVAVPREQTATLKKTETVDGVTVYRYADMDAAIMAGHVSQKRSKVTGETTIELPFYPLTTAVDIEILPPTDPGGNVGTEVDALVVTSIQIANPATVVSGRLALSGGFTYNAATKKYGSYTNTSTNEDVTSTTVNIQLPTGGVKLTKGNNEKLVVTAFLLPENLPQTIRVIVNCKKVGATNSGETAIISKDISYTNDSEVLGKKNSIVLGALPNPIVFSYETWMANLPDNIYISQMSLPGTHDAGAYTSGSISSAFAQTQTLTIEEQFDAGVRVLDFRPSYDADVSGNFDISHGYISVGVLFDDVMDDVLNWLAKHPTEFIIIQLKNESSGDAAFENWQKNIRKKLKFINQDYVISEFDPTMTLKEGRGKILFMSRDDYYNDDNTAYGDWIGCKISGWPDNEASWSRTFYTSPDHENAEQGGTGTLWVSDRYSASLGNIKESNKKSDIKTMLSNAAANSNIDVWYMTWLNVSGTLSLFNPGRETGVYNAYASEIINDYQTYNKTGIVMMDWAGYSNYNGDTVLKAIIDNNFKGEGPAKKQ